MNMNVKLLVVLSKLNNEFIDSLGRNIESLDMAPSAYAILAYLNESGRAKTQKLGEVAFITSGAITHMVNKMVRQGYVEKVQDRDDKRVFWVEITNRGREAYEAVNKEHTKYLDLLLSDFTEGEKEDFIEKIKKFGKGVKRKKELMK